MTDSPFSDPAQSTGIEYDDYLNRLLLFKVTGFEPKVATVHGDNDAVRCDIVVLDGPKAGEEIADTLIFPRALVGQLRPKVGGMVLGRLGQGENKKGNPPWKLSVPTDADRALGLAHLEKAKAAAAPPF